MKIMNYINVLLKILKSSFGIGIFLYSIITLVKTLFASNLQSLSSFLKTYISNVAYGLFHDILFVGIVFFIVIILCLIQYKTKKLFPKTSIS